MKLYFSIDTYRFLQNRYMAIMADETEFSGFFGRGYKTKLLMIGKTRAAAVGGLKASISSMKIYPPDGLVVMNIRDYDKFACWHCKVLSLHDTAQELRQHYDEQHYGENPMP